MTKKKILLLRMSFFVFGLMVMSFGVVLMIKANLGSAPWDVLHVGLYKQFGLTIGTWSVIVGFLVIGLTSILLKQWPSLWVFLNMILVGLFIDLFMLIPWIDTPALLLWKLMMLFIGIIIIGYGIGIYIAPQCAAGPRDSLMLALTKITGCKVQWIRGIMEASVLILGWLLGGPVFIGTIIFCISIGSIVGYTLPLCQSFVDRIIDSFVGDGSINKGTHNHHS